MLDEKTTKRIRFIVLILYVVAVLAVIYFAVAKALGLVMPFVIAFAVACMLTLNLRIERTLRKLLNYQSRRYW